MAKYLQEITRNQRPSNGYKYPHLRDSPGVIYQRAGALAGVGASDR